MKRIGGPICEQYMPSKPSQHALGRRVRQLRLERGWSVLALASGASLSPRYITEVEGGRANPSLKALEQLAGALGLAVVDLLVRPSLDGPRARIERVLEGRTYDELSSIARELELRYEQRQRRGRAARAWCRQADARSRARQRLGLPFVELDDRVQAASGLPIAELISLYGERYYRQIEHRCL